MHLHVAAYVLWAVATVAFGLLVTSRPTARSLNELYGGAAAIALGFWLFYG